MLATLARRPEATDAPSSSPLAHRISNFLDARRVVDAPDSGTLLGSTDTSRPTAQHAGLAPVLGPLHKIGEDLCVGRLRPSPNWIHKTPRGWTSLRREADRARALLLPCARVARLRVMPAVTLRQLLMPELLMPESSRPPDAHRCLEPGGELGR
jgi:hypothetical protein